MTIASPILLLQSAGGFVGIFAKAYIAYIAYTIFARRDFLFKTFTPYIAYTLLLD
jgi:hypothetical protein